MKEQSLRLRNLSRCQCCVPSVLPLCLGLIWTFQWKPSPNQVIWNLLPEDPWREQTVNSSYPAQLCHVSHLTPTINLRELMAGTLRKMVHLGDLGLEPDWKSETLELKLTPLTSSQVLMKEMI